MTINDDNEINGPDVKLATDESETACASKLPTDLQVGGVTISLGDIVDIPALQAMMERFYKLTRIGIGVLETNGKVLVKVGWQDICTKFHRVCTETRRHCEISDVNLSSGVRAGEFKAYRCENNMWDMVTPIVVDGTHIGNVFISQFFFDDEELDYGLFRHQAQKYGFDEKEYLDALERVPRWSHETMEAAMSFYALFASFIASTSYTKVQLAQALAEQQEVVRRLTDSEMKLREAQQIARMGRWELDLTTNQLVWSSGIYLLFEKDIHNYTATYDHLFQCIHPDDREMVDYVFKKSIMNKTHYEIEHRLLMDDGRIKWVNEIGRTEYDEAGNPVRSVGTVQDITEHRLQEEAIKQSERQLHAMVDTMPLAIHVSTGLDQVSQYINPTMVKLFGYTLADIPSVDAWWPLAYPDPDYQQSIIDEWNSRVHIAIASQQPIEPMEVVVTCKDGTTRDVMWGYITLGEINYSYGLDLTERKIAEAALVRSEAHMNQAQKAARMGSWAWYPKTNKLEWSEGMYRVFGLRKESFTGDLADVINLAIHPDDRQIVEKANETVIETGRPTPAVYRVVWPDGSVHVIRAEGGECEVDENGSVVSLSGYAQDITEQKRAEEALQESERRYREIFNATADAILIRDAETWEIVDVNQPMLELFGYPTKDEVLRLESGSLSAGTPHYSQADALAYIQQAKSGEKPSFEWLSKKKSGELFWSEITMRGSMVGGQSRILVTIRDISQRKQVEQALLESESSHRVLVEGLPDIIIRFDRDCRHLFISNNITNIVSLPVAAFMGKTPRELGFTDEQCSFWEKAIGDVFTTGASFETEFVFNSEKGNRIFDCRLVPELDAQGSVRSVLSLNRDITAQRRAEEDYKTLFQQMLTGFALHEIICDETGKPVDYRFLAANPAYEQMTGLLARDIVGRRVLDILPTLEPYWINTYGQVVLTGEPVTFENYAATLGKYFEVTAFRPAVGQFACLVTDVTARKRSEEEKRKLEETLGHALKMESVGRLAGGVAHDFNNMLGVILGHAQMAMEQLYPTHPLYDDLSEIRSAANRSADLTRQLLAFARKQTIQPKVLDLNETISKMIRMLERLIGESIRLEYIASPHIWQLKVDPSQIDQMLANLCVNARDAISDVGIITIKTGMVTFDEDTSQLHSGASPGDYVWLSVTDTGHGIDKPMMEQIFEPFFTTKGVGEGTGLGLSTVYGAVKQNGGFIEVESELGQGTCFTIYLPRYVGDDVVTDGNDRCATTQGGSETILLVEDEPAILRMTQTMLKRLGYTVIAAQSPLQAIDAAAAYHGVIDLLLTDVVMPEMNGNEMTRIIQSQYPRIKRMFMSGYTSDVIAHHGKLGDGVSFISKPFTMDDLGTSIRTALDNRSPSSR